MSSADTLRDKLRRGVICLGTSISLTDPVVSEALGGAGLDFLWIDMEHGALTIETVQGHVMASQLAGATPLVRVAWNDPVLIKPVLDAGAAGIIVPMVRTAAEARQAVAACRYPPEGVRGFGPRRPGNFGRQGGPAFCQAANKSVLVVLQIEHIDAVHNLAEILRTPGVEAILIGPNDLAASMGLAGQSQHPEVQKTIDGVIAQTRQAGVFAGTGIGDGAEAALAWIGKGVQWLSVGADFLFLSRGIDALVNRIREGIPAGRPA